MRCRADARGRHSHRIKIGFRCGERGCRSCRRPENQQRGAPAGADRLALARCRAPPAARQPPLPDARMCGDRVDEELPILIPHRSGCADFPRPVFHGRASLTVVQMIRDSPAKERLEVGQSDGTNGGGSVGRIATLDAWGCGPAEYPWGTQVVPISCGFLELCRDHVALRSARDRPQAAQHPTAQQRRYRNRL